MAIKGYWRLNGNSNDASGNGNNGTNTNVTFSQGNGRLNQGAGFNGTSSKIITPSISISGQITGNVWVKIPSSYGGASSKYPFIFSFRSDTDNYRFDALAWHADLSYKVQFQHFNGASWYQIQSISALSVGWHMLTYKYDPGVANGMKIYIDGVFNNQANPSATLVISYPMSIGANRITGAPGQSSWFNSAIDELIIDNEAWSSAKIKNEYSKAKGFF